MVACAPERRTECGGMAVNAEGDPLDNVGRTSANLTATFLDFLQLV